MKGPCLIFLIAFLPSCIYAQEISKDSVNIKTDSTAIDTTGFYGDLYRYSKDRKLLFLFYQLFFNVSDDLWRQDLTLNNIDSINYKSLEGRVIRSIKIISYGPFGNKVTDTTLQSKSTIERIGNSLHFKTKEVIIKNNLIFEEGDTLDLYRIAESERLIRSSQYIRDARIRLIASGDMVDVEVYSLDLWTFHVGLALSGSKVKVSLSLYNVFGIGHRFKNSTSIRYKNVDNNRVENTGSYFIPNIGSTFITSEFVYKFANSEEYQGISFQRRFYSAITKYAGGVEYLHRYVSDSVRLQVSGYDPFEATSNYSSVWAGKSFDIRSGGTVEEVGSKFVVSAGYSQLRYKKFVSDSDLVKQFYKPYDLFLVDFGYSNRKYYTDRFIQEFGEQEDIPTGRILKFTTGYEVKDNKDDFYAGITVGGSGYLENQSYLSVNSGYGTYLNSGIFYDGVFKTDLLYFSRMYSAGEWKCRLFVQGEFTTGIRRKFDEYINLKEGEVIPGYNKVQPEGNTRLGISCTAVLFTPFEWIGFKFTPIVFAGFGMVSNKVSDLTKSRTYTGFGGGFAINNVYLVQSEFRLFIGYYYKAPNADFRFSSFKVWEYNFQDYDFGKPETIKFE